VVAASSYERQETAVFRRNQQRRELLRRKLRNDHVDDDTLLAFEWRQHHDDNNKAPNDDADDAETARLEQLQKQQQDRLDPGKHGGLDYCLGMVHSWARYQWYQLGLFYQDHLQGHGTINWLIGFNLLVFGGWRLLPLKCQPFMTRWFTNHPVWCTGPRNLNLVTASFSHQHLLPLALNMAGLWYFGSALQGILGEQQFLALYLSSAVAATTVSRWLSLLTRHYRPLMLLPSVISTGAGGAVYACLAALTVLHPTSTLDLAGKVAIPLK
jgi:membrane associated rhomboid family serine protease